MNDLLTKVVELERNLKRGIEMLGEEATVHDLSVAGFVQPKLPESQVRALIQRIRGNK